MKTPSMDNSGTGSVNAMKDSFKASVPESVPDSIQRDAAISPDKSAVTIDNYNSVGTQK
jgi:hypothetical protein